MMVLILSAAPASLRGSMTRWLLAHPGGQVTDEDLSLIHI